MPRQGKQLRALVKYKSPTAVIQTNYRRGVQIVRIQSPYSPPSEPRQDFYSWWRVLMLWLAVAIALSCSGGIGVLWLTGRAPQQNCQNLSPSISDSQRLYCAQESVESGKINDLLAAIALVNSWTNDHPLYQESQKLVEEWSSQILQQAEAEIEAGNLARGLAIARYIPSQSKSYPKARQEMNLWRSQWEAGERISRRFEEALQHQKWSQALQSATALSALQLNYWRSVRSSAAFARLQREREAAQKLQQARTLAQPYTAPALRQAIQNRRNQAR